MYKTPKNTTTTIKINTSVEGETLEEKIQRVVHAGEPIEDGAPIIFTEKDKGVVAGYNIRTDRWEVAAEAMDKVHKQKSATRNNKGEMKVVKDEPKVEGKKDGGAESQAK